jgi:hypothetical protein
MIVSAFPFCCNWEGYRLDGSRIKTDRSNYDFYLYGVVFASYSMNKNIRPKCNSVEFVEVGEKTAIRLNFQEK